MSRHKMAPNGCIMAMKKDSMPIPLKNGIQISGICWITQVVSRQ